MIFNKTNNKYLIYTFVQFNYASVEYCKSIFGRIKAWNMVMYESNELFLQKI